MALLEMEGFDYEPGGNQVLGALNGGVMTKLSGNTFVWQGQNSNIQAVKTTPLSLTGFAMQLASNTPTGQNSNGSFPGGTYPTLIMGFRYKTSPFQPTTFVAQFCDTLNNIQVGIAIDASMHLYLYRGTTATVLGTSARQLMFGATYFIELKVTFASGVAGSYELRIDGVTDPALISGAANTISTANSYATGARMDSSVGVGPPVFDDFYLLDDTGPAPHNDFLSIGGPIRIETVFVTTNSSVMFTPLSSTNASQVDETSQDQDTTYNTSITSGDIDLFNHGALSSIPAAIYGVQVVAVFRKDDVTPQTGRTKMVSGAVTSDGPSSILNTVYSTPCATYITDPNTGVAWTAAGVDATKIGYEHV